MVTTTTGEQTTPKKRGRPAKYAVKLQPAKETKARGSEFQKLTREYSKDTIVRAFVNLRRKLFTEGEPVDQMTLSIKKRISDLQSKGGMH